MKVEIKDEIVTKLEERINHKKDFENVDTYVNYILEQVVKKFESKEDAYTKEEEEKVKERLRELGYID